ncbi:enoyl-CoA hydratase/isomerase family protein [Cryptosporangium sp. NPDC051539]|uniref:enoyl-CoA hydratase/isomerase family protein n=1 Tax=Cryptosporangium sp. NPDC051539 TaxID=3363962 RepID=UPI0037A50DCD
MTDTLLVTTEDAVRILVLNRPAVHNALDEELGTRLRDAIRAADADPAVRAIVLTGAGSRAFCAGGDLKQMVSRGPLMGNGARVITRALRERPSKPLIAAVNGLAYGGGLEIVLACDLAVASETATFALPEVRRGVLATGGGLVRLSRLVGQRRALEMTLTGAPVDALTASSWGLVNGVVAPERVVPAAVELAAIVSANAPLAVALSKSTILAGDGVPEDQAWDLNDAAFERNRHSDDASEGPLAFAEKRAPVWTGR